ncbi:MAG: cyclic nucleotide-binding domain-containing protein, partial [Myxococcales bacterium]|nr:cyclic nucleotide-binding domain-containing protein [Myxococcales bacterium]
DAADAGPAPLDPEDALILEEIELDELRPSPERLAALPSLPLFAEVPPEALKVLLLDSKLLALHDGDRLLRRDDPADTLYSIVEGRVRVEVPGLDPDKPIVLSEGEVVGESCLLDDATRGADVVAHGPVRVLAIPKTVLDAIVAVHPGVGDVLLDLLSRRLLANLLRRSPLFAGFDGSTRRELARLFEIRRADEGTALLLEGKRSDGLFVTLVGQVQISGSAEPTRSVGPGHMLGQGSLITRQPSPATCRALTEILVLRLPASRFNELAAHFPPVLAHLAELASRDDGVVQPIL